MATSRKRKNQDANTHKSPEEYKWKRFGQCEAECPEEGELIKNYLDGTLISPFFKERRERKKCGNLGGRRGSLRCV